MKRLAAIIAIAILNHSSAYAGFRFVAWGDSRNGFPDFQVVAGDVFNANPAFTVFAGDLEPTGFTSSGIAAWKDAINGGVNNGLFDKTFAVRGNHDASDTAGWQSYFNFSGVATSVGATNFRALNTNLTYSFDYGNSHFAALDVLGDANLITAGQISWLDNDLAAATSRGVKHIFIVLHPPLYCVDGHCTDYSSVRLGSYTPADLVVVLNKYPGVTAVIGGHEHVNAFVSVDGTRIPGLTVPFRQIVSGRVGAPASTCDSTIRFDFCTTSNGWIRFDVNDNTVDIAYFVQGSSSPVQTYVVSGGGGKIPNPPTDLAVP